MAKKSTINQSLFNLFVNIEAGLDTILDFTYRPYSYVYKSLADEMGYREATIRSAISRLKKKGMINQERKDTGELILNLTDQAKKAILLERIRSGAFGENKTKRVIAVFDIPETQRNVRNILRSNLREFGFQRLQKSVWLCNKDIYPFVLEYFKSMGFGDRLIFIEANKIDFV